MAEMTQKEAFSKGFSQALDRVRPIIEALETLLIYNRCEGKQQPCDICEAKKALSLWKEIEGNGK